MPWDPFLMKNLLKSDICVSMNSSRMHCSRLKSHPLRLKAKKKKKLKRALQQTWTQQTRIQTAPKRKNEPQYKPLTSFTATPPRFFSELKGKTCRIIDSDLARSKFIPNCSTNWIQKWTSNIKLLKNNNNKKLKN